MICALAVVLGLALETCAPDGAHARAVAVDGDTIRVGEQRQSVRIANLDAPEIGRARCTAEREAGEQAKLALQTLLDNALRIDVRVERDRPTDRYGRWLARVAVDGDDVGETLIAAGIARQWRGRPSDWCGPETRQGQ